MKRVLCYGDSNTWGYEPGTGCRYGPGVRWPGVLQAALGDGYAVIGEGLNGRTTVLDDPLQAGKNGLTGLRPCLDRHAPLDLVILLLGTNDLSPVFEVSAEEVARNAGTLAAVVRRTPCGPGGDPPAVLLLSPPHLGPLKGFGGRERQIEEKSRQLARHFRAVADQAGCHFLDAAEVVTPSRVDGVHLDAGQHALLGARVAEVVRSIL